MPYCVCTPFFFGEHAVIFLKFGLTRDSSPRGFITFCFKPPDVRVRYVTVGGKPVILYELSDNCCTEKV